MIQEKPPQIQIIVKVRALSLSSKQGDKGNGVIKKQKKINKKTRTRTNSTKWEEKFLGSEGNNIHHWKLIPLGLPLVFLSRMATHPHVNFHPLYAIAIYINFAFISFLSAFRLTSWNRKSNELLLTFTKWKKKKRNKKEDPKHQ